MPLPTSFEDSSGQDRICRPPETRRPVTRAETNECLSARQNALPANKRANGGHSKAELIFPLVPASCRLPGRTYSRRRQSVDRAERGTLVTRVILHGETSHTTHFHFTPSSTMRRQPAQDLYSGRGYHACRIKVHSLGVFPTRVPIPRPERFGWRESSMHRGARLELLTHQIDPGCEHTGPSALRIQDERQA